MDVGVGPNPPALSWFEASKPLNAVSLSPNGEQAAIGGRDGGRHSAKTLYRFVFMALFRVSVLQLVSLKEGKLVKGTSIHSSKRANLNHSAVDVKWHPSSSTSAGYDAKSVLHVFVCIRSQPVGYRRHQRRSGRVGFE
jgi:hypothetical protein